MHCQHHFRYLDLPAQIESQRPTRCEPLHQGGRPYEGRRFDGDADGFAITIPANARHPELAQEYLKLLLGPEGQAVFKQNGFGTIAPAYVVHADAVPKTLRSLVTSWPGS